MTTTSVSAHDPSNIGDPHVLVVEGPRFTPCHDSGDFLAVRSKDRHRLHPYSIEGLRFPSMVATAADHAGGIADAPAGLRMANAERQTIGLYNTDPGPDSSHRRLLKLNNESRSGHFVGRIRSRTL